MRKSQTSCVTTLKTLNRRRKSIIRVCLLWWIRKTEKFKFWPFERWFFLWSSLSPWCSRDSWKKNQKTIRKNKQTSQAMIFSVFFRLFYWQCFQRCSNTVIAAMMAKHDDIAVLIKCIRTWQRFNFFYKTKISSSIETWMIRKSSKSCLFVCECVLCLCFVFVCTSTKLKSYEITMVSSL